MTALTLAMLWPQAHAQTAEQAAAAALMGQGGVNMPGLDPATLQNLNISNLPAGLAGKLQGAQSSLPVLRSMQLSVPQGGLLAGFFL